MEVMGLMLGEFVDDYTVKVVDVFAMPQSGTGVSVEAVDPVFQTKMLDMLKQCGRYAEVPTEASHSINSACHLHLLSKGLLWQSARSADTANQLRMLAMQAVSVCLADGLPLEHFQS